MAVYTDGNHMTANFKKELFHMATKLGLETKDYGKDLPGTFKLYSKYKKRLVLQSGGHEVTTEELRGLANHIKVS